MGVCFFLIVDILTKRLQKCFLSSTLWDNILCKSLSLICCYGNWKILWYNVFFNNE